MGSKILNICIVNDRYILHIARKQPQKLKAFVFLHIFAVQLTNIT